MGPNFGNFGGRPNPNMYGGPMPNGPFPQQPAKPEMDPMMMMVMMMMMQGDGGSSNMMLPMMMMMGGQGGQENMMMPMMMMMMMNDKGKETKIEEETTTSR